MPLDVDAARLLATARLLERALHDRGPWEAVVCADTHHCVPVSRVRLDGRDEVVFTGYLSRQATGIRSVEIWSGGELMTVREIEGSPSGPCRITMTVGLADSVMAA